MHSDGPIFFVGIRGLVGWGGPPPPSGGLKKKPKCDELRCERLGGKDRRAAVAGFSFDDPKPKKKGEGKKKDGVKKEKGKGKDKGVKTVGLDDLSDPVCAPALPYPALPRWAGVLQGYAVSWQGWQGACRADVAQLPRHFPLGFTITSF